MRIVVRLALSFVAFGCAVDVSGLPRGDGDGDGGLIERDLSTPDAGPRDAFRADMPAPPRDMRVPVPDMCMATAEVCNGLDDDCNGFIDDGVGSVPCDGDGDGCVDGSSGCASGETTCSDPAARVGDACDGPDADPFLEGGLTCVSDALACAGDCVATTETCDRSDEDCDGRVDEGGICDVGDPNTSCAAHASADRVYLFCTEPDGGDDWGDAQDECQQRGYELAQVDDGAELSFLQLHVGTSSWWVGGRVSSDDEDDRRDRSQWTWRPSGDPIEPTLWDPSEPSGDGSCAQIQESAGHQLGDMLCDQRRYYICEAPIEG